MGRAQKGLGRGSRRLLRRATAVRWPSPVSQALARPQYTDEYPRGAVKRTLAMSMTIAAVSSLLAFAGPGAEDARSPTFAWSGVPGRALAPGLFADSLSRFGVEPGSLAEVATAPMGAHGERQVAIAAKRTDGALVIGRGLARDDRLVGVAAPFAPVAELGAAHFSSRGVHPLGGWNAMRGSVVEHAIVWFESSGGPRPDRLGWASVVGIVRSDVARLVAELADGSRRELSLNAWRGYGYRAAPERAARTLLAYTEGGKLVDRVELAAATPLCGGAYGHCGPDLAPSLD